MQIALLKQQTMCNLFMHQKFLKSVSVLHGRAPWTDVDWGGVCLREEFLFRKGLHLRGGSALGQCLSQKSVFFKEIFDHPP